MNRAPRAETRHPDRTRSGARAAGWRRREEQLRGDPTLGEAPALCRSNQRLGTLVGKTGERGRYRPHDELPALTGGKEDVRRLTYPEQLVGRLLVGDVGGPFPVGHAGPGLTRSPGVLVRIGVGEDRRGHADRVHPVLGLLGVCLCRVLSFGVRVVGLDLGDQPWARAMASNSRASWATSHGSSESAAMSQ